ncbi:thiamine-phosphate kinase [Luteimonas aestuarii]|uniref:Thiamine-monophosphate kinase n=1 Tax=Luteimonas aestuarii TaxID=453837 RepID=A0A4R5TPV0_9GAMM|nr:thiamine-phosphate kinase [Luteimonas aestuarii]TDK20648.1 thiamine-phosphate kinase [Luteimonas aestuarii]
MEFDLIARIRARAPTRHDVVLGIGDDAALLQVPEGRQLVVAMDTLNSGVHFPEGTAPVDIGWKSLAVNLSDLAAMGARPAWCTLSLSLPEADAAWIDGFLDGFLALAKEFDVALVGGDTTRGPLSVCVTAHGLVEPARALRRDGARVGDDVWVTGTLGDAAAALALLQRGEAVADALRVRLDRPVPRVAAGQALAGIAHACIDVSDGLLADLGHVCAASGVGAAVQVDRLPASPALSDMGVDDALRRQWQASGGDDYELCFSAAAASRHRIAQAMSDLQVSVRRIGSIVVGDGVDVLQADGARWRPSRPGYRHFSD